MAAMRTPLRRGRARVGRWERRKPRSFPARGGGERKIATDVAPTRRGEGTNVGAPFRARPASSGFGPVRAWSGCVGAAQAAIFSRARRFRAKDRD